MEPTKDEDHAIVDVLDVLLREGAMIQADVLISVADIPLIGLNLRAAVAGMSTMTEYGFFENWDVEKRRRSEDRHAEFGRRPSPTVPHSGSDSDSESDSDSDPDER
jgi:hypothetical protein